MGPTYWTNLTLQGHITSSITWRSISNMLFLPLEPSLYLQPFSTYLHPNTSWSRHWNFRVTWRQSLTWPFDSSGAISYRCSIV